MNEQNQSTASKRRSTVLGDFCGQDPLHPCSPAAKPHIWAGRGFGV